MALNNPKKILLTLHGFLRQFSFQNWGVGLLNFCLLVKNCTLEVYLVPFTQILKKKLSQDIMDRQEYLQVINFKQYLSLFGALVWIWKASIYLPANFRGTVFD